MNWAYLLRMGSAIAGAILAWGATAGLLLRLPPGCSIGCMFAGLILFLVGAKLHFRWPVAIGGILMFGGLFAAAMLDALG